MYICTTYPHQGGCIRKHVQHGVRMKIKKVALKKTLGAALLETRQCSQSEIDCVIQTLATKGLDTIPHLCVYVSLVVQGSCEIWICQGLIFEEIVDQCTGAFWELPLQPEALVRKGFSIQIMAIREKISTYPSTGGYCKRSLERHEGKTQCSFVLCMC